MRKGCAQLALGVAVHVAARILDQAGANEVLVSGAVPLLLAGSGLEFDDRGEQELKGIPGLGGYLGSRAEVINCPVQTRLDRARDEPMPIGALAGRRRTVAPDRIDTAGRFPYGQICAGLLRRRPGAAISRAATSLAWKETCLQLAFQGPPAPSPTG